jgi:hypothetical protein
MGVRLLERGEEIENLTAKSQRREEIVDKIEVHKLLDYFF